MNWYTNLKIPIRLIISFAIISIYAFFMGIFSIVNSISIDEGYSTEIADTLEELDCFKIAKDNFDKSKNILLNSVYYMNDVEHMEKNKADIEILYKEANDSLTSYIQILNSYSEDPNETYNPSEDIKMIENIISNFYDYKISILQSLELSKQSTYEDIKESVLNITTNPIYNTIYEDMEFNFYDIIDYLGGVSDAKKDLTRNVIIVDIVVLIFLAFTALLLIIPLSRSIRIPIGILVSYSEQIANGNLDLDLKTNRKDEIGILSNQFATMIETLRGIIGDIQHMSKEQAEGDLDCFVDTCKYSGGYAQVATEVNTMVRKTIAENSEVVTCLNSYASGNFYANIPKLPGKKNVTNQAVDSLQKNLQQIIKEIDVLLVNSNEGNLSIVVDTKKYEGDWKRLFQNLNNLMETVVEPIKECTKVLVEISKGNLKSKMTSDYKGEFLNLKQCVNITVDSLNAYIDNISYVLEKLSNNNYDVNVNMDYMGDFLPIKKGLNIIIHHINEVLKEVIISAEQVSNGSKEVTQASFDLAQGAEQQVDSVNILSNTLQQISEQTIKNSKTAKEASLLAINTKQNADTGNVDMQKMLLAMNEINDSSKDIAQIIKVIDDIAFQTNLLALNAAVEAARAGVYGKEFSVVALEVRQLAGRSKIAANDTTTLIQKSIAKVSDGMKISTKTSETLSKISSGINDISILVNDIEMSTILQEKNIENINVGIQNISNVTFKNTSLSKEQASFSEELSTQSEIFKNTVGKFKLK